MSKRSKRKKRQEQKRKPPVISNRETITSTSVPSETSASGKWNLNIPLVGSVIIWLASSVGLAVVVNHFSVNPKALYISAITLCMLLFWIARRMRLIRWLCIVLYILIGVGTYFYVGHETKELATQQGTINLLTLAQVDQKLDRMNHWFEQFKAANDNLLQTKNAVVARTINPGQREQFIRILAEPHNVSKKAIKVIIGKTDLETENFAFQFREMLDQAGYGSKPSNLPVEHLESFTGDVVYVTNQLPHFDIPAFKGFGNAEDILRFPSITLDPSKNHNDVIALFSVSSLEKYYTTESEPPTFMEMKPNLKVIPNGTSHYAYHPTTNLNLILLGVCHALNSSGISVGLMQAPNFLKPGEIAFFIPQRMK